MSEYFEFEVSLEEVAPRIWRRFLLRADATLHDLHDTVQKAGGWLDYHLYRFRPLNDHRSIATAPEDEPIFEEDATPPATEVPLREVFVAPGDACIYEYDFGDGWEHRVELRAVVKRPGSRRRILLDGARAFPPEDCGSLPGYEKCVRAFHATDQDIAEADPLEREDLLARRVWMGAWHPEAFDLPAMQRRMKAPVRRPEASFPREADAAAFPPTDTADSPGRVVPIGKGRARRTDATVAEIFEAYQHDCERNLPPVLADFRDNMIEKWREFMDAVGGIDGGIDETAYRKGEPDADLGFCDVVGPEALSYYLDQFLSTLALRKLEAALEVDRSARALATDFMDWLVAGGHFDDETARSAVERIGETTAAIARAERATLALAAGLDQLPFDATSPEVSKRQRTRPHGIERVKPGRLWLRNPDNIDHPFGPIQVSTEATSLLEPDWSIVCALARRRRRWYIVEVSGVMTW